MAGVTPEPLRLTLTKQPDGTHAGTLVVGEGIDAIIYDITEWRLAPDGTVTARCADRWWAAMEAAGPGDQPTAPP